MLIFPYWLLKTPCTGSVLLFEMQIQVIACSSFGVAFAMEYNHSNLLLRRVSPCFFLSRAMQRV